MSLQPNLVPSTQQIAYPTSTADGISTQVQTRKARINQSWFVNLAQQQNQQSFTTNTGANDVQIGLDTVLNNTYNPTANPTYNLTWNNAVIDAVNYPNTTTNYPSAGIYLLLGTINYYFTSLTNDVYATPTLYDPGTLSELNTGNTITLSTNESTELVSAQVLWWSVFPIADQLELHTQLFDPTGGNVILFDGITLAIRYLGQS